MRLIRAKEPRSRWSRGPVETLAAEPRPKSEADIHPRSLPDALRELVEDGIIDAVTSPLQSGKEADVFIVEREDSAYIAKVYRDRSVRSFKNDAGYREGRTGRSSRGERAMRKNSKYGRELSEETWHKAEVDALTSLAEAGVRVPELFAHYGRVLVMELICTDDGRLAPQLGKLDLTPKDAAELYDRVLSQVIRMLMAGIIHADLSPYNVLVDSNGPVIIDLPQAVSAAHNQQAEAMLVRDVLSISRHLGIINPEVAEKGELSWQIWEEYEAGKLTPEFRPVPGRRRMEKIKGEAPELIEFLRKTKEEVELEKRAAKGYDDAIESLELADREAEEAARDEQRLREALSDVSTDASPSVEDEPSATEFEPDEDEEQEERPESNRETRSGGKKRRRRRESSAADEPAKEAEDRPRDEGRQGKRRRRRDRSEGREELPDEGREERPEEQQLEPEDRARDDSERDIARRESTESRSRRAGADATERDEPQEPRRRRRRRRRRDDDGASDRVSERTTERRTEHTEEPRSKSRDAEPTRSGRDGSRGERRDSDGGQAPRSRRRRRRKSGGAERPRGDGQAAARESSRDAEPRSRERGDREDSPRRREDSPREDSPRRREDSPRRREDGPRQREDSPRQREDGPRAKRRRRNKRRREYPAPEAGRGSDSRGSDRDRGAESGRGADKPRTEPSQDPKAKPKPRQERRPEPGPDEMPSFGRSSRRRSRRRPGDDERS